MPEQFSFDTEKSVLQQFGDKDASRVQVLSFTRLCDEIDHELGGGCIKNLTEVGKIILMNRALQHCAPDLKVWQRQVRSPGFCETVLESIEEFKTELITPEQLRLAAQSASQGRLAEKLSEIALIYDYYNALVDQYYIDPTDRLTKLYDRLSECRYFEHKTVYIDAFKGFSGQQYRIMERIITQADKVYIALTLDSENFRRYDIFENTRQTAERLQKIAEAHHIPVESTHLTALNTRISDSLRAIEKILSGLPIDDKPNDQTVTVCAAETIYDEAEFAARTIRRLVREHGYRYRDFVLIARDVSTYEEAVATACAKNEVSCYIDRRMPLTDFPPVVAVLSAFDAVRTFSTESILWFHKSGVGVLSVEELSMLENYCRLWNINGKIWLSDWDMSPAGFNTNETAENFDEKLKRINQLRARAILPLMRFAEAFKGNAQEQGTAIMQLFQEVKAQHAFVELRQKFAESGDPARGEALRQSYDQFIGILDDLADCFGEANIDHEEYRRAFLTAATLTTVGVAPQTLDEVSFGAADRIRPARPKIAFILGCNQGVFPRTKTAIGLFGINDRSDMIDLGIQVADCSVTDAIDEDNLIYSNLCCATDRLYLTYTGRNSKQEECEPSPFVDRIRQAIDCVITEEPAKEMDVVHLPETVDAAFSDACIRSQTEPEIYNAMLSAFSQGEHKKRIDRIQTDCQQTISSIREATARDLFGNRIYASATSLDDFYSCRFKYFCKYGLRARRIQSVSLDQMQRGTLIHYILQRIFEDNREHFGQLTDEVIAESVHRYVVEFTSKISGFSGFETPHIRLMLENIERCSVEVIMQLRDEFAQSDFKPCAFELKFGQNDLPHIRVPYDDGEVLLTGSVDRVDSWNGYIRIVDYKTGKKALKLPDVLVGLNMQMLLYMYTITRHGDFADRQSAGIFYMPARRKKDKSLAMDGIMVDDENIVRAMEKNNAGQFVPKHDMMPDGSRLKDKAAPHFIGEADFDVVFDHVEKMVREMGNEICSGKIAADPLDGVASGKSVCDYCDYSAICGIEDKPHRKAEDLKNDQVIEEMRKGGSDHE
ncbi:MAG: exodeoxyribonuclease V subunit gamma [Clostridia bacterium]|nr:exodeoxyribonuclease V subunit gamma [Clostridia bacterium]